MYMNKRLVEFARCIWIWVHDQESIFITLWQKLPGLAFSPELYVLHQSYVPYW